MSLLTPPSTGHREKENRVPPKAHVIWSPDNQYHTIKPVPQVPAAASGSNNVPKKSILKKRVEPLLPLVAFEREDTPEPSRPKFDPTYLSTPVKTIIDSSASLDDLIRAYSVLAARIRANITLTTDSDASYPLLDPLRKNKVALEEAIIRDLGRCLVNPETMDHDQTPEDKEEEACLKEQPVLLPSPKSSPQKKKRGTTAKKARYGRDLCTTCHSVVKLLAVVFTLPAVSGVFTGESHAQCWRSEANFLPQLRSCVRSSHRFLRSLSLMSYRHPMRARHMRYPFGCCKLSVFLPPFLRTPQTESFSLSDAASKEVTPLHFTSILHLLTLLVQNWAKKGKRAQQVMA
jgi:hypothetical protein